MLATFDINSMTLTERLQTMELLWKSLAASQEELDSPDWHGTVLASRLQRVEAGEGRFLTIAQVKARLSKR